MFSKRNNGRRQLYAFCPWMVLFKIMESAPACRAFAQNAHQRGQEKSRKLSEHKTEFIWKFIVIIVTSIEFRYILFCKVYYGPCWSRSRALQKIKICCGSLIQTSHLKLTKRKCCSLLLPGS